MGVPTATVLFVHLFLCSLGLALCGYAYYVEVSKAEDENFQALCDLSPEVSCSAVLTSQYGRGAGVIGPLLGETHPLNFSTALYGAILYLVLIVMGFIRRLSGLLALLQAAVVIHNLYLAYILYSVLRDFCIVCCSMYTVNFLLLLVALYRWRKYKSPSRTKKD